MVIRMKALIAVLMALNIFCLGETGPMIEYKVVVFDFGGVVGQTDKNAVVKALSALLNIPLEDADCLLKEIAIAKETGTSRDEVWAEFEKKSGTIFPDNWDEYYEIIKLLAIRPNMRMLELVKKIQERGYRVAMLSNVRTQRANYIRKLGVYSHFDPVILSCETNVSKPDPKAFQILLDAIKTAPQECIYIDNGKVNLKVARDLGFDAIPFSTIEQLEEDLGKRLLNK
jgi:epoxide hydrolase-like predicted phosphatase